MESIKNAIVTVTLLAVGYGAYVVLQEDAAQPVDAPVAQLIGEGELPAIPTKGEMPPPPDQEAPEPGSPLPQAPFPPSTAPEVVESTPFPDPTPPATPSEKTLDQPVPEASPTEQIAGHVVPSPGLAPPTSPAAPLEVDQTADAKKLQINPGVGPIPPEDPSQGSVEFEQAWHVAQQQVRDQMLAVALSTLTPWSTDDALNAEQRQRCLQLADQLAGTVIYSREHHLEPEYVVKAGETLAEIAATFQVPQELLAKINGIAPPYALSTGERLKVIPGPFRAEVAVGKQELTLVVGKHYAGRFQVGIGPDVPPEESVYEVAEKKNGKPYFDSRTGNEIALGAAENRYGNHWLGLRGEHITTGHNVGIHGRPADQPPQAEGSISLDPLDAEDIFSILSVGSRVIVRR